MATPVMADSFSFAGILQTQDRWMKSKQLHYAKEDKKQDKKIFNREQV
jgi:hypothetical protein